MYPIWFIIGYDGVVGSVILLLNVHVPFKVVAVFAEPIETTPSTSCAVAIETSPTPKFLQLLYYHYLHLNQLLKLLFLLMSTFGIKIGDKTDVSAVSDAVNNNSGIA